MSSKDKQEKSWNFSSSLSASFCPRCHTLLDLPDNNCIMGCQHCGNKIKLDLGLQSLKSEFKVDEPCEKCNNPFLTFYTMQIRSVDEGQTVFYECPKCGYTFSHNN